MTANTPFAHASLMLFLLWSGTLAGFFFAFTNPTMIGFADASQSTYVDAMQHINRAVQNPYFASLFFGMIPIALITMAVSRLDPIVCLAAILVIGGFVITVTGNVPMNAEMDSWSPTDLPPAADIDAFRQRWQQLNTLRCGVYGVATALGLFALSPFYVMRGLIQIGRPK